jgi:CubicO group peptidase (beta-lactamase class C family)
VNTAKLDEAFDYVQTTTKHGGLLVARHGWLVYERYFGRAHREANPNNASVGKSFTSTAVGILVAERPELFPEGLDQKIFTPEYFPVEMFPLSDPRKAEIRLGQLLAMSAGIRGNNPGIVHGQEVTLDPAGPDGWPAMVDAMAMGKMEGELNTITLWCEPGGGYSYATSSPHLASVMLRHVTGMELEEYVGRKLAAPLGWGRWGWGYKDRLPEHTAGGGGIALHPTDMLRFCYLLLREGRWDDQQIVPAEYVGHCGRPSPYNPHFDYSLQFTVNGNGNWEDVPRDLFWKAGSGGFGIYMIPSLDLVAYKIGGRDDQYDPGNTKLDAVPESIFRYDGSREDWTPPFDQRANPEAYRQTYERTIRKVLAALDS